MQCISRAATPTSSLGNAGVVWGIALLLTENSIFHSLLGCEYGPVCDGGILDAHIVSLTAWSPSDKALMNPFLRTSASLLRPPLGSVTL